MKENKLYNNIVYTLFNVFNDDNIKAQIIINEKFKQLVIKQICNLLTLEKEFNTNLNNNKFTISFAQALVNITNKSEIIEKLDLFTFDMLDEEYIYFVKYIVSNFNVEKKYITKENIITNELIDLTVDFVDKKAIDNAKYKLNIKTNKQKIEDFNQSNIEKIKLSNKKNDKINSLINNINQDINEQNKFNISKIMQQMTNMLVHPRLDPRFYFYTSKPKYMPILKKIVASFVIFSSILLILLWFLNSYLNIFLNTKVIIYTIPGTTHSIIVGGGADIALHNNNKNFSQIFIFGSIYKFLLMQSVGLQIFSRILLTLPGIFLGYELLKKKHFKRDNYVIKFWPVLLSIIILLYSSLSLIQVLLPNVIEKYFKNISVPNKGYIIKNDPKLEIIGGLLLPDSDLNITIKKLTNEVYNNKTYKLLKILTIITIIIGIISSIMVIILIILSPKTDRNKLKRANVEYQKAVSAIMNGQKYEMDPTLFDDEFDEKNIFKKEDYKNSKK